MKPKAERGGSPRLSLAQSRSVVKAVFSLVFVGLAAVIVLRTVQEANRGPGAADPVAEWDNQADKDAGPGGSGRNEGGTAAIDLGAGLGGVTGSRPGAPSQPGHAEQRQGSDIASIVGRIPGAGTLEERFPGPPAGQAAHQRTDLGEDVARRLAPSMAWVGGKLGGGTGFLVRQGLVATTTRAIVFDFLQDVKVWFPAAEGESRGPFDVALVAYDRDRDVALLAVLGQGKALPPPFEGTADPPPAPGTPGKLLHVKGPEEANPVDSRLIAFGPRPNERPRIAASLDAALRTSEVGGPLIDSEGRAIGMVTLAQGPGRPATFILVEGPSNLIDSHKRGDGDDFLRAQALHQLIACSRRMMMAGALHASTIALRAESRQTGRDDVTVGGATHPLTEYVDRVRRLDRELFSELEGEINRIRGYPTSLLEPSARARFALAGELIHKMRRALDEPDGAPFGSADGVAKLREEASELMRYLSIGWDIETPGFLWPTLKGERGVDPEEFRAEIARWIR